MFFFSFCWIFCLHIAYCIACCMVRSYGLYCRAKKLEATHHKYQRRLFGISWKDRVRNEEVWQQTNLKEMNLIIEERRLRWLGHVLRVEDDRIPKQAMYWQMDQHVKRKPRRPRKTGLIPYAKTWRPLVWPGKRLKNLQPTEKIGVKVWPNVSTTRDDLKYCIIMNIPGLFYWYYVFITVVYTIVLG